MSNQGHILEYSRYESTVHTNFRILDHILTRPSPGNSALDTMEHEAINYTRAVQGEQINYMLEGTR
jgi:hypothetical protein